MSAGNFGKHFECMYERSMVGAGAMVFAVMGYVIAKSKPSVEHGGVVTLNPLLLGPILGEKEEDVGKAIEFLCSPDPRSESKEDAGRRLVRLTEFEYRVVNFPKYRAMKQVESRREQNRLAQQKYREKGKLKKGDYSERRAPGLREEKENVPQRTEEGCPLT